jgi:predicted nucleotidyltransferase
MKTAQEFITEYQKLPLEEKQIVVDYVISTEEEFFKVTHYSESDLALLDQRYEEAQKGINIERYSSMEEAIKSLRLTEEEMP